MNEKTSHKKPVTVKTSPEVITESTPFFRQDDFNESIFAQGYNVWIEKALPCPCRDKAAESGLSDCQNCGGVGWFFIEKRETKLLIQSMNRDTKFKNWTETDRGTVSITARAVDRLAFMDRITNLDLLSFYAEVAKVKELNNKLFAFTIYFPTVVNEIYLFEKSDKPLIPLKILDDFTIDENKIILNDKFKGKNIEHLKLALRYTHFPQFNVVDVTREITANKGTRGVECSLENRDLVQMNPHVIARRTHTVLDAPSLDGNSLFDNSVLKDENQTLLESISSFSLLFFILRSSAEQIDAALKRENNAAKIAELITLLNA